MTPTHLDLFSGIGGFALAAGWAGYETVQFCEIDPFCRDVLAKNFPGVPVHDDIRTLTASLVPGPIDLLTGGFPCQPFSVAGKRAGINDDRFLWPEMRRVVDELRPRYVVAENVPGIIKMALDDCLDDLEALGYATRTLVVPACAVGAPHRRDRVWIVAHSGSARRQQIAARASSDESAHEGRPSKDDHVAASHGESDCTRTDPHTQDRGLRRREASGPSRLTALLGEAGVPGWEGSPRTFRMDDGIPRGMDRSHRRLRLKALGNAIVPQVAYELIRLTTP